MYSLRTRRKVSNTNRYVSERERESSTQAENRTRVGRVTSDYSIRWTLQVKLGLQLYQVDHRSYLVDFRNLNINSDQPHPSFNDQLGECHSIALLRRNARSSFLSKQELVTMRRKMCNPIVRSVGILQKQMKEPHLQKMLFRK